MTDDKITPIPIKFKDPPSMDGPMLKVAHYEGCNHKYGYVEGKMRGASYLIREGETEVECGLCKTKLEPMFVLRILANEESQWMQTRAKYQDEMKRLKERSRTKCDNCGKMTRISRK